MFEIKIFIYVSLPSIFFAMNTSGEWFSQVLCFCKLLDTSTAELAWLRRWWIKYISLNSELSRIAKSNIVWCCTCENSFDILFSTPNITIKHENRYRLCVVRNSRGARDRHGNDAIEPALTRREEWNEYKKFPFQMKNHLTSQNQLNREYGLRPSKFIPKLTEL